MRLKRLFIENFQGIETREEISIDQLTILIGRNDVGKSTV